MGKRGLDMDRELNRQMLIIHRFPSGSTCVGSVVIFRDTTRLHGHGNFIREALVRGIRPIVYHRLGQLQAGLRSW
jgi:hypothetical protein